MLKRFTYALFLLALGAVGDARAEVRYDFFLETCRQPSALCHGFLWGVLESNNSQNERIRSRMIEGKVQVPPAWIFISTDWCFPDDYRADMSRSLIAFLERVRIDVVSEMPRRYRALGLDDVGMQINDPGPNLLAMTLDELYGCKSGGAVRNRIWGSGRRLGEISPQPAD